MNLQPVLHVASRQWMLGVIENHVARPLTKEEIDAHIKDHEHWREHSALSDKEYLQMSDWLIGNAELDLKTGLIDHAAKLKERIRDLIAKEGELGDALVRVSLAEVIIDRFLSIDDWIDEEIAPRDLIEAARRFLSPSKSAPLPSPTKLAEARSPDAATSTAPATDAGTSAPASGNP